MTFSQHHLDDDEDGVESAPSLATPNVKLQRWLDLLATLLSRHYPIPFDDLAKSVPAYLQKIQEYESEPDPKQRKTLEESLKRTFERDKDELRAFGIPLESHADTEGNANGAYEIRKQDFYLPYLCLAVPDGADIHPARVDKFGYRALSKLTFESDELQAVVDAAASVRALGDPLLTADADNALRKLAVDLPLDSTIVSSDEPRVFLPNAQPAIATFEALSDALVRRKEVTFVYRTMSTDHTEERRVEPYGLFFLSGHWYLVARDIARAELRNFRLNRISEAKVNTKRAQSADFEVPTSFRLRDHAKLRQAWEIGEGESEPAVVEFVGTSGPTVAAMSLGRPHDEHENRRAFDVRRPDAFVRWLLSFADEVIPISPREIVDAYAREVVEISAHYSKPSEVAETLNSPPQPAAPADTSRAVSWQPKGAAAQLRRILSIVPEIADGEEHGLREIAERVGCTVDVLRRDLFSIVARYDAPGGFVEGVQLFVESDRVSAFSNHLLRPMRLTAKELCALELGLAVMRVQRTPDEYAVLDRTRERLRDVITQLPPEPIHDASYSASLGEHGDTSCLSAIRTALRERRKLALRYRRSGSTTASERVISPYALVASSGMLYIVAYSEPEASLRVFRMDRVEQAEVTDAKFEPPSDFSLDDVLRDGRVFQGEHPSTIRVRYSARIARWIAEREGRATLGDGTLVIEYPLADAEWGVRHVLQYGRDAEVLAPAEMREVMRERLGRMAGHGGVQAVSRASAD